MKKGLSDRFTVAQPLMSWMLPWLFGGDGLWRWR